jgi:hypothetical protein
MSKTHDVTISAFDLDRIESELTAVTEQRDRLAEALKEIYNVSSFDYDTMPEFARKKYREVVLEMADEALAAVEGGSDE